jgi:hypothetical protein
MVDADLMNALKVKYISLPVEEAYSDVYNEKCEIVISTENYGRSYIAVIIQKIGEDIYFKFPDFHGVYIDEIKNIKLRFDEIYNEAFKFLVNELNLPYADQRARRKNNRFIK